MTKQSRTALGWLTLGIAAWAVVAWTAWPLPVGRFLVVVWAVYLAIEARARLERVKEGD